MVDKAATGELDVEEIVVLLIEVEVEVGVEAGIGV